MGFDELWDAQAPAPSPAMELAVAQGGREDTRCWCVLDDSSEKLHVEKPGSQTCCGFNSSPFFPPPTPPNLTLQHVNTLLKLHLFPEVSLINNSARKCSSLAASVLFPGHPSSAPVGFPNKTLLVGFFFGGNSTIFYWKGSSAGEGVDLLVQLLSSSSFGLLTGHELFVTVRGNLCLSFSCHFKNDSLW